MPWTLIKVLVVICAALGLFFWFRRVHRVMKERQEAVDIAARQRQEVLKNAHKRQAAEFSAVLERSESIYSQAVVLYIQTLEHPLNWLPATIMGYRPLREDDDGSGEEI